MTGTPDLIEAVAELRKCGKEYNTAEEYYDGTRAEFFADQRYKNALQRTGVTFRMNFAKTPVDTMVERLTVNGIIANNPVDTMILEGLWEENQLDLESDEIHLRACEFGDAYAIVWPDESAVEDEGEDDDEDDGFDSSFDEAGIDDLPEIGIEVYYNDPRTMRLFYDKENPRRKLFAIKMWEFGNHKQYRVNLMYSDRIEKYLLKINATGEERGDWSEYHDGSGVWPTPNPYGQIPVFHFRTSRPYGVPQHKFAYGPQDVVTKTVITHMNTMDYHGFPQRWALVGGDLADEEDPEDFGYTDEETEAVARAGEDRSQLSAKPGHLWMLRNIKSVGQFDAAPPATFMDPLKTYIAAMAQLTTTPNHRFDMGGNPPSGELLRVAEQPFVKKVNRIQKSFGATWNELLTFALKLIKQTPAYEAYYRAISNMNNASSGASGGEADVPITDAISASFGTSGKVKVVWDSAAVKGDRIEWDLAILKRDAGVPIRQILLDVGYSTKQLDAWGVPAAEYEAPPPPAAVSSLPPLRVNPNASIQHQE